MSRRLAFLVLVAGVHLAAPVRAGSTTPGDSARAALEAELDALLREIDRADPVDLFADGREPDLVILSSSSVFGEVTPCG